jgi:hypothetical protein
LAAQQIHLHPDLFRPANFINSSITNMSHSLLLGVCIP